MGKKRKRRHWRPRLARRTRPGTAPGTVQVDPASPRTEIHLFAYGPEAVLERRVENLNDVPGWLAHWPVVWINVVGLGEAATLQRLGELFGLHPLALEDVVNTHQASKLEEYGEQLFVVVREVASGSIKELDQVSLFLGPGYVLTFQDISGDSFEPVRRRIRENVGRIRRSGPDYLLYALIDAVIDAYFPVVEHYGQVLEQLEQEETDSVQEVLHGLHSMRSDLLVLSRAVRPHRDMVDRLLRGGSRLVSEETRLFLRDVHDHCLQLGELLQTYRELSGNARDFQLSKLSLRMNEVMKMLTLIATIFRPINFLAALYGMNFQYMPELHWRFGYPLALTIMAAVSLGMAGYFYGRGWISK